MLARPIVCGERVLRSDWTLRSADSSILLCKEFRRKGGTARRLGWSRGIWLGISSGISFSVITAILVGGNDQEFMRHEVKGGGKSQETGIQRGLGLCLLKDFPVREIRMGKDAAKPSRERGKVSVRGWWDLKTIFCVSC